MAESKLLPAYLIVGPDEVKRDTAVGRLRKRVEDSGMADFNIDERDLAHGGDAESILSSLNTYPMGADFRLVVLWNCDRPAEDVRQMLVDYLADPAPTTVLLVIARSLAKNTKLYKALAAVGGKGRSSSVIDCSAKKRRDVPALVQGLCRRHGKSIDLDAAEELVSRAGEGTRMLDNELRKLSQMVEGDVITRADVERNVARTAEVKPWDLLNALSARDVGRSLEQYRLQPPKSEVRLMALICGRLRELMSAKALASRGRPGDLAAVLHMQGWQVRNHARWASRFSEEELEDALRAAVDVELALKGSRDSASAFTAWLVRICGASPHGGGKC